MINYNYYLLNMAAFYCRGWHHLDFLIKLGTLTLPEPIGSRQSKLFHFLTTSAKHTLTKTTIKDYTVLKFLSRWLLGTLDREEFTNYYYDRFSDYIKVSKLKISVSTLSTNELFVNVSPKRELFILVFIKENLEDEK